MRTIWDWAMQSNVKTSGLPALTYSVQSYFHSQILEIVLPEGSTSYSKAPQALLSRASFWESVRKNSMPR